MWRLSLNLCFISVITSYTFDISTASLNLVIFSVSLQNNSTFHTMCNKLLMAPVCLLFSRTFKDPFNRHKTQSLSKLLVPVDHPNHIFQHKF